MLTGIACLTRFPMPHIDDAEFDAMYGPQVIGAPMTCRDSDDAAAPTVTPESAGAAGAAAGEEEEEEEEEEGETAELPEAMSGEDVKKADKKDKKDKKEKKDKKRTGEDDDREQVHYL